MNPGRRDPTPADAVVLERGGVVVYPAAPFPLPTGDDLAFLLRQELSELTHKNICYDPATGRLSGHRGRGAAGGDRLRAVLAEFSTGVCAWLAAAFPHYGRTAARDRVSYRPEEEATRRLRPTARNDLLHLDAFPNRPARGRRILRVFANINPADPRVWVTAEPFAELLARYGATVGLPGPRRPGWLARLGAGVAALFRPGRRRRTPYDVFMLRFHNFLKRSEEFQERSRKRLWTFPPGSAWAVFTDGCSHAELRGRYALEHSFFIPAEGLVLPDESPAAVLERYGRSGPSRRAA